MKLRDKVVVVTGGGRGIGKSAAIACAREGARVVVAARSGNEVAETAEEIHRATKAQTKGVVCDVSSDEQVRALFKQAEALGPVYGLICAAGIYGPIGPFDELSLSDWIRAIDINLYGTARCIHAAVGAMKKRKSGRIVIFSGGGQGPMPNFSSYVTGKGGIWRLTETLGAEFAPYGVYLNAISPGAVNTKFLDELIAAGPEKVGTAFYEKSLRQKEEGGVSPDKAADLAVYLLSEQSTGLYGRNLSAVWDKYWEIQDPKSISQSDLYAMRRVVTPTGGTR